MTSEDFATLKLVRVGHVLRVTIDHPSSALNAVDERLHHDLTALCAGLKREAEARAVLLTGRGRAFSAGATSRGSRPCRSPGAWRPSAATPSSSSGTCSTSRSRSSPP